MKIALVTTFEQSVPPAKYGGTERIVASMANELVGLGHDVILYASGDSKTAAKLFACVPKAIRSLPESENAAIRQALNLQGLANAVHHISETDYDIVHNHAGWSFLLFEKLIGCPVVTTLHNSMDKESALFPAEYPMYNSMPRTKVVSISDSQRQESPKLNYVATVYHGIDPKEFHFNKQPGDYLVFLGRIHPTKGPREAIDLAKKTNQRLVMAARIDPPEMEYYNRHIKPLVDGKQIVFLGEIGQKEKIALLKDARALLSPLAWDEPFGMVYIEAMMCGTPVIAIGRGSVPEIIEQGKTGFLCKNIDEMAKRIADIDTLNRRVCREQAEQRFASRRMATDYVDLYQKILTSN